MPNPKCEESLEEKFEMVKEIEYIRKQDYLFMRYGYHPKLNKWQEIDGKIKLNNEVKQLASFGLTKCQIANELKINFYKISEIFGYLAHYQCFEKAVLSEYTPVNTPLKHGDFHGKGSAKTHRFFTSIIL
jgi:hypothetical protein